MERVGWIDGSDYSFSINAWKIDAIPPRNNTNPKITDGICRISGVPQSCGNMPSDIMNPAIGNPMMNPPTKNKTLLVNVPRFEMKFIFLCLFIVK
ncbi:MAG: hypothetical protein VB020_04845 [Methanocorpusculum sp.]|nr:hypothetical protein [Methanocorpusculum sp.]